MRVGFEKSERNELAEYRAPLAVAEVRADVEGLELIVAEARDTLGRFSAQDVDQVAGAEALAGAINAGQRLLRRLGAVPHAAAASRQVSQLPQGAARLAEIVEQLHAAAAGGLAEAEQRVELARSTGA